MRRYELQEEDFSGLSLQEKIDLYLEEKNGFTYLGDAVEFLIRKDLISSEDLEELKSRGTKERDSNEGLTREKLKKIRDRLIILRRSEDNDFSEETVEEFFEVVSHMMLPEEQKN